MTPETALMTAVAVETDEDAEEAVDVVRPALDRDVEPGIGAGVGSVGAVQIARQLVPAG